jgi:hypothetical protein
VETDRVVVAELPAPGLGVNARLEQDLVGVGVARAVKIIAFIEDEEVIQKILKHLELWEMKARPPPRVKTPSVTIYLDVSDSQISSPDFFYVGPDYPTHSYRI